MRTIKLIERLITLLLQQTLFEYRLIDSYKSNDFQQKKSKVGQEDKDKGKERLGNRVETHPINYSNRPN